MAAFSAERFDPVDFVNQVRERARERAAIGARARPHARWRWR